MKETLSYNLPEEQDTFEMAARSTSMPERAPESFNAWQEELQWERDLERILEDFKYQLREKLRTAYYTNTRSQSVRLSDYQTRPAVMSEFKERERVEVRNHDDHEWVEATFVQKVVEILYCTQEPGRPAWCWQQIRKIDPNQAENPIINPQTHA